MSLCPYQIPEGNRRRKRTEKKMKKKQKKNKNGCNERKCLYYRKEKQLINFCEDTRAVHPRPSGKGRLEVG